MQKITPFIRCVDTAKEVADFYVDVFPGAKITKENSVVTTFDVFGQSLATLNGGPHEKINPSISFSLRIRDKELTKQLRDKLSDAGFVMMGFGEYPRSKAYGWCADRYGVSRQVMYDDCEEHEMHQLIPSFMFTGANAGKTEEAMNFYTSLFPASSIGHIHRYGPGGQDVADNIAHAEFTLVNQLFIAMDSSFPHRFTFNDGVSLMISCKDQEEVDYFREKLTAEGGQEVQCGRCKDKYGVSRQVTPLQLPEALFQADPEKAKKAMDAMLQMKKIIIADLE